MSSREVIQSMRSWLIDTFGRDVIEGMNDSEVIAQVDTHFIGGKNAFTLACEWDAI